MNVNYMCIVSIARRLQKSNEIQWIFLNLILFQWQRTNEMKNKKKTRAEHKMWHMKIECDVVVNVAILNTPICTQHSPV